MTAQFSDTLEFKGRQFSIVGVNGDGLFEPRDLGLSPLAASTACRRGYICHYAIADDYLVLERLWIRLDRPGPAINRVAQLTEEEALEDEGPDSWMNSRFDNVYAELNLDVPFTGGLLIADDFIKQLYVHMGFHPAWKYRTVYELLFDRGNLTDARDVSEQMSRLRDRMLQRPLEPGAAASPEVIMSWIASTFKLDYRL